MTAFQQVTVGILGILWARSFLPPTGYDTSLNIGVIAVTQVCLTVWVGTTLGGMIF